MTVTRFRTTPYRPFGALSLLEDALKQINTDDSTLTAGNFTPAVDVYEDEHKLTVKVETPGIKQDDLNIQLENQTLTITGERKFDSEEKEENFHRMERRFGSFTRSFHLPSTVDTTSVNASYENGVLKIDFAKRQEARARQIRIGSVNSLNAQTGQKDNGQKDNAAA